MLKYIVICGPVLVPSDPKILEVLNQASNSLAYRKEGGRDLDSINYDEVTDMCVPDLHVLPERDMGANQVRELVQSYTTGKKVERCVFVTRYEHAVSEFANAVIDGLLKPDEVVFRLVRYKGSKIVVTDHYMNGEFLNDWPMGILW